MKRKKKREGIRKFSGENPLSTICDCHPERTVRLETETSFVAYWKMKSKKGGTADISNFL